MDITPKLLSGTFIKRYKRFFTDIYTADGHVITLHCPNTGSMKNCQVEGSPCWYSLSNNPKRKLAGTLEVVTTSFGNLAGVNTGRPNHLVREAIENGLIPELRGYASLRTEVRYGEEKSRIDLLLEDGEDGKGDGSESGIQRAQCYVEVKNVTLDCGDGHAQFPDSVTTRGSKHLRELMAMVAEGHRAVLFFCVQLNGVTEVSVAGHIDPVYAETLTTAIAAGVEVIVWQADMTHSCISLQRPLQLAL
ncbi:MAG: DNA/RNA nuclease SfsA [Porticoccaceae bacterium]|nr:DNA/RNA nuclease SfsA [Porticoccaceae bacterium]